jgi:hypothetical protein
MPENATDISEALQKVRNSNEYIYNKDQESSNFLTQLWDQFSNFLYDLRESLSNWLKDLFPEMKVTTPDFMATLLNYITWIIVAILVILLLIILFRLLKQYRKKETEEIKTMINIAQGVVDYKSWIEMAKNFAQNAQYRNACRAIYMSTILYLDEREIIKYDKAKTNLEYLQTVKRDVTIYEPLKKTINIFEYLWYGKHNGTAQDYNTCLEQFKKVVNE